MLPNNNQQVIRRMAKRSLSSNRRRTMIIMIAVILSAFMLFSVLTVGVTYFKMNRIQTIRMQGGEYDAVLYGPTKEQLKMCKANPDILAAGIGAVAGSVMETEEDKTPNVGLVWADNTYWSKMMKPARDWEEGVYPNAADEVMVTKAALKECGLEHLDVGDTFTMKYRDGRGTNAKEFRISGMWDGYGEKKVFYVSKAFYEQSGQVISGVGSGRCFIDFKQKIITQKEQDTFIESLNLGKKQRLLFVAEFGNSVPIVAGIIGLILVTCFCAYLLIYNILYLSVSGNIRYYGLLQTVGMTGKQVRCLMQKQMAFTGGIGIAAGLLLGSGISFFLIPVVVRSLGIRSGNIGEIDVTFHPAIFLLTILMTGLTVYLGSRKPAKMAVAISPIQALGYRPAGGSKISRRMGKGGILWRMAKEQITKDKKKSGIVMLSLAASLSVFLCLITLIDSQGPRTIMSNYMEMDMVIKNDTLKMEEKKSWTQILDKDFLEKIKSNEGVKEMNPLLSAEITIPWEPDFSDIWMREFYDMWMTIPYEDDIDEYKEHPENFGSFIIGINSREFEYLNTTLDSPIDKDEFMNGKTCILYRDDLDFKTSELQGKYVTCAEYADAENTRTFEIAGLTDENYYAGALIGYPPTIIVSDSAVNSFIQEPFVYKTGIRYSEEYDERTEADMISLMGASPHAGDFSYDSKIEEMKMMKKAQGNMMEIGIGIIVILAFIGIMNYMNTVTGNIQNRQVELAILESVGMTERQVSKMLILEGLLFAGGSLLLTSTVGLGITYGVFQSMNYRGIVFSIPVMPAVGMLIFIILICIMIPLITRHISRQGAIVERIHGFE